MPRAYCVLLAEPNPLMREKMAGVLTRSTTFWCVIQVKDKESLARAAAQMQPDLIMADLSILKSTDLHSFLRKTSTDSRVIALVDSKSVPYIQASQSLGLDGIAERGHVLEEIREMIGSAEDVDGTTD